MKFRKRIAVEAVQITHEWFTAAHPNPLHPVGLTMHPQERTVECETATGIVLGQIGDWIVTGINGERYPVKPDIFELTYEPVEDQ